MEYSLEPIPVYAGETEVGKVVATLDERQVARVQEIEKKLGVVIVAFDG